MEEARTQDGLIGFIDILGYQSFLENNDTEPAAVEVLNIISNIKTIVSSDLQRELNDPDGNRQKILGSIEWLVFSDTILITMKWSGSFDDWLVFSLAAIRLCRRMFDSGLPIRGAINKGSYLISKSCFAGRVIVDAYSAGKNVNLAGCTIDRKLIKKLMRSSQGGAEFIKSTVADYLSPLCDGRREKMYLLHYMKNLVPPQNPVDIPQLVADCFGAHGKDIDASAETKARNTEGFLRFLASQFPEDFPTEARELNWS